MGFMSTFKCPKCQTIFTSEEVERFNHVLLVPNDPRYGVTPVCPKCGARFWGPERMVLKDYVKVKHGVIVEVSTVDLVVEHEWEGRGGYYYETILFFHKEADEEIHVPEAVVVSRYRTEEEARKWHERIVKNLSKAVRFRKVPSLYIDIDILLRQS